MRYRLLTLSVLGILSIGPAQADEKTEAGHKISQEHCSRCHVIGSDNPYGGINSTPSFPLLAKRDDYLERFQTFFERRPHPVFVRVPNVPKWSDIPSHIPEFTITPEQIEDVIAYVETLRPN